MLYCAMGLGCDTPILDAITDAFDTLLPTPTPSSPLQDKHYIRYLAKPPQNNQIRGKAPYYNGPPPGYRTPIGPPPFLDHWAIEHLWHYWHTKRAH